MTMERMPGLDFEFADNGVLTLEQESDGGPANVVTVHPVQLRFLCERAGLLKPQPINLAEQLTAGHVRRLLALRERTWALHGDERLFDQLFDLCPDGVEFWHDIVVIVEQVEELAAEFMEVKARAPRSGKKSPAISVTPISVTQSQAPRRGRPPTGEAMSNAERQARYRERQAQQEIPLNNHHEKEQ